jgi:hypothetical protein
MQTDPTYARFLTVFIVVFLIIGPILLWIVDRITRRLHRWWVGRAGLIYRPMIDWNPSRTYQDYPGYPKHGSREDYETRKR